MQEYYFLFVLAFVWTLFAVVQDIRKREVANWLNFSLIAFALAYRAFYSLQTSNFNFLYLGILGFAIFLGLAHIFYYSKTFAGGDAKLMMGYGAILPFNNYASLFYIAVIFLFLLFFFGAIYSLTYSFFIVAKQKTKFKKEFFKKIKKHKYIIMLSLIAFLISMTYSIVQPSIILIAIIFLSPLLYIYTKSLDKCMLKLLSPNKLTEGDWLESDIKIGNKTIKKSVHGLSLSDISILKKYRKKVLIKQGIPFTPAFLLSLIAMVCASLIAEFSLRQFLESLL